MCTLNPAAEPAAVAPPLARTCTPFARLAPPVRVTVIALAALLTAAALVRLFLDVLSGAGGLGRKPLDPTLLAVAPFEVFDPAVAVWQEGLVDLLVRDLDGLGRLRTVSPSVVVRRWRGPPDPESATRLGHATGARVVLFGSLLGAGGDSVRLMATLIDAADGRVIADIERRERAARIDRLTDSLTIAVLHALDPALAAGTRPSAGLRSASLEAIKLFLRGEQFFRQTRWDSARTYYERALHRDTAFALAARRLGSVLTWSRVSYDSLASSYLLRAGALNHGLSSRDSLLVRADSLSAAINTTADELTSWNLTRELLRTVRDAAGRYPGDPETWLAAGEAGYHAGTGPLVTVPEAQVLAAFDRGIALDSGFTPAYLHPIELALNESGPAAALRYARAYLARNPSDWSHRGVRLVERLLDSRGDSAALNRMLDTASAETLSSARTTLRRWPDRAETAVRLSRLLAAGRPSTYALFADTAFMRRRLAEALAFRGHLREAYRVLGDREAAIYAELALLGAVPTQHAAVEFQRWLRKGSPYARLALPWWTARQDTASLAAFRAAAEHLARSDTATSAQLLAAYDTASAGARLALVRGDTADAFRRLVVLPDSLCLRCLPDRLLRARLLSTVGRGREALAGLTERPAAYLTPIEVLMAAERGRVARQLGEREVAAHAGRFLSAAWHTANGDLADLQPP